MSKNSTISRPKFQSEAEEADWYDTPEGREYALQSMKKAIREKRFTFRNKPADPAELQKLLTEARAAMTTAISLRLPMRDLDAAKRVAKKTGKKYQTILKEIIHEGLKKAEAG